jgi:general secretion pathway protein M
MKENWEKFKVWYAALEGRERRAVNIGGAALIFAIFYLGIWSPFLDRVNTLRQRITSEQKTLAWMQDADQKLSKLAGTGGGVQQRITPVAMLTVLQNQVQKFGMKEAVSELKQTTNDSIEMQFKNVSFDQMMKLLMAVMKDYRVTITQISATAEATPGQVSVAMTLALE